MGLPMRVHRHQEEAIRIAQRAESYVLTTGTGSGKSLSYFIPIIDHVLRAKRNGTAAGGITAIVIYPMNALCNSQLEELGKYLKEGYPEDGEPVRFARYTGQESDVERKSLAANPPDILLTNYVMLELILTRQSDVDRAVIGAAAGLKFLVLDELHTYRGRQGADVALLVRRVRERLNANLLCIGTSATMVSEGDAAARGRVVAEVASRLFGALVKPEHVVTETLQRTTPEATPIDKEALASAIAQGVPVSPKYEQLQQHPVAAWVEVNLGLRWEDNRPGGKLVRNSPKSFRQAVEMLSADSGQSVAVCEQYLSDFLLRAYEIKDSSGKSLFAFRLHQFISGAGNVFSTLEPPGQRYLTLNGQQFQPGERDKHLFNVCFCRECGQEYMPVWAAMNGKAITAIEPRQISERSNEDEDVRFGYFMPDPRNGFDPEDLEGSYPEEWLEFTNGAAKLRSNYRRYRPMPIVTNSRGEFDPDGMKGWLIPGYFRFCLSCRISYEGQQRSDLSKLSGLSTEGRSSATTVLTLNALKYLLQDASGLDVKAKKLLGFTDNRQDASLQAGHFNDFIQILLLRSALLAAIQNEPGGVIRDDILTQRVFDYLRLTPQDYAANPEAKGVAADNTKRSLRDVLGYRLYFDLQRGWRVTNPNLEQLGLLAIAYQSLDECSADEAEWTSRHPLLAHASPEVRRQIMHDLLDTMRRGLAIKTIYLDAIQQEQIRNRSFSSLREPWGFQEDERLFSGAVMVPRPKLASARLDIPALHISYRSRFGRTLKAPRTWGEHGSVHHPKKFDEVVYNRIVDDLLTVMTTYGLVEPVEVVGGGTGYRVVADVLEWTVKTEGKVSGRTDNEFFRTLYLNVAASLVASERFLHQLEAREHTAQVESDIREQREDLFRAAKLPVLFCSPTMELGIDIASLNTVYMRNVPPTPANYAQRSGRAGRSGQPALVITYCAAGSPHDQYFFSDPVRMVAGSVNPPNLDLANEELVRSHLNAVWLAESGQKLGNSVKDVLNLETGTALDVRADIMAVLDANKVRERAAKRGITILAMLKDDLTPDTAPWYVDRWLDDIMRGAAGQFERAFERWRTLYRATTRQMQRAHSVLMNAAAAEKERKEAKQRYDEARVQQELLLQSKPTMNSDFYTYRYLASEGFLPGYNFPRLPLLAFIPARREKVGRDSFLSRPRFLGLSEFGPQSIIYHEGSQYRVRKAILSVKDEDSVTTSAELPVMKARLCPDCGYGHFGEERDHERCVNCDALLSGGISLSSLYRIEQVSTRRATRITSDEEERQRQGYEMITTLQFAEEGGHRRVITTEFAEGGEHLLTAKFGPAAKVWRVNLGWRRRREKSIFGFNIDVTTGVWGRDGQAPDDVNDDIVDDTKTLQRVIPYVEDHKNILILHPETNLDAPAMTTLQYALKRGIQAVFQLEDSEVAAEPLPNRERRNAILFYEAAEGGAGVLNRLATDVDAMGRVAIRALELCHFQSKSGKWAGPDDLEDCDHECEAGCYKCLLSYYNQPEHRSIDRWNRKVLELLCRLARSVGRKGSDGRSEAQQFAELDRLSNSTLEKAWLTHMREYGYTMPDRAQPLLADFGTQPDYAYSTTQALIYIDGPHHNGERQKQIDEEITTRLNDAGFTVIRFGKDQESWPDVLAEFPWVFGKPQTLELEQPKADLWEEILTLLDPKWQPLAAGLREAGVPVASDCHVELLKDGRVSAAQAVLLWNSPEPIALIDRRDWEVAADADYISVSPDENPKEVASRLLERLGTVA